MCAKMGLWNLRFANAEIAEQRAYELFFKDGLTAGTHRLT